MESMFTVVDGLDGASKTAIINHLVSLYAKDKVSVKATRGLGGGDMGGAIRERLLRKDRCQPVLESLAALTATMETYLDVVAPNLNQGIDVVCDRYVSSFLAYQVYGGGNKWINDTLTKAIAAIPNYRQPDLYIYCDVALEVYKKRPSDRTSTLDHFDVEIDKFKDMVQVGYEAYFASQHISSNIRLNCNRPLELVLKDVEYIYNKYLKGAHKCKTI